MPQVACPSRCEPARFAAVNLKRVSSGDSCSMQTVWPLIVSVTQNGQEDCSFGLGRARYSPENSKECGNVAEHPPDRILRDRISDTASADGPGFRGRLAAAVTAAGGLGLVGGGYGEADWLLAQIDETDGARVGYGFITWSLARNPGLLDNALAQQPATIMLSFGDLTPFAERIRGAGVPLTAQVQTLHQARLALAAGAQIIVAQGGEAAGTEWVPVRRSRWCPTSSTS
ncbi:nitronate monooxygenase family protein [Mycobacterium kansasii]|uniref:Nitronate monooxygenase family protein n=1 Tax=Mycobacterium kansasii TaxID=1768 RepID=A0A1V3X2G4_MYCKA|nr:nitronate monooxygenase family protein [Mycobacterium kansasii]